MIYELFYGFYYFLMLFSKHSYWLLRYYLLCRFKWRFVLVHSNVYWCSRIIWNKFNYIYLLFQINSVLVQLRRLCWDFLVESVFIGLFSFFLLSLPLTLLWPCLWSSSWFYFLWLSLKNFSHYIFNFLALFIAILMVLMFSIFIIRNVEFYGAIETNNFLGLYPKD